MAQAKRAQATPRVKVAKRVDGRFPMSTPIAQMGLDPDALKTLTPRVRKMTKEDLVLMWRGEESSKTLGLTVTDVNSIREAFASHIGTEVPDALQQSLSSEAFSACCCCCPCCCAEAVTAQPNQRS